MAVERPLPTTRSQATVRQECWRASCGLASLCAARLASLMAVCVLVAAPLASGLDGTAVCSSPAGWDTLSAAACEDTSRRGQKLALVTGANRGIGLEVISGLLSQLSADFDVLLTSRREDAGLGAVRCLRQRHYNEGRGARCCDGYKASEQPCGFGTWFYKDNGPGVDNLRLRYHPLDLASNDSVEKLIAHVTTMYGRLDVLVNNAAAPSNSPASDHVKIDHFGHLHLTMRLAPLLAPGARLVTVGSAAGSLAHFPDGLRDVFHDPELKLDTLNDMLRQYMAPASNMMQVENGWPSSGYVVAKAANVATTRILARGLSRGEEGLRLANATDVLVNACCPGTVVDGGYVNDPWLCQKGAHTIISLATLPDGSGITGRWFTDPSFSGKPRETEW